MKTTKEQIAELEEGQLKAIALMQFNGEEFSINEEGQLLNSEGEEVEPIEGDEERDNYIVLNDDEANEKVKQYILDSVWAFTPNFLSSLTGIDITVFEAIQNNDKCEANNDAILSMIDDESELVEEAIRWDGRGHFMSSYDGNENEENVNGQFFYIYRMN